MTKLAAIEKNSKPWSVLLERAGAAAAAVVLAATALHAQSASQSLARKKPQAVTADEYNRRLEELQTTLAGQPGLTLMSDYRIGPEDLLTISVFGAKELGGETRVSFDGEISMPLLGPVPAAGRTPKQLERDLQSLLRARYMKDPQVNVQVKEVESHGVAVVGAVREPGVYQIRGPRSLVEVLSLARGLADDAGDTVRVERRDSTAVSAPGAPSIAEASLPAAAPETARSGNGIDISLSALLEQGDSTVNIPVYPGDIVKVAPAGVIYVVGEVRKPGGFVMHTNENMTVLKALALAEGVTRTASTGAARILRSDSRTAKRAEIVINLKKILAGKAADVHLEPRDVLFVPNSAARSGLYRSAETALSVVSGLAIYRW